MGKDWNSNYFLRVFWGIVLVTMLYKSSAIGLSIRADVPYVIFSYDT